MADQKQAIMQALMKAMGGGAAGAGAGMAAGSVMKSSPRPKPRPQMGKRMMVQEKGNAISDADKNKIRRMMIQESGNSMSDSDMERQRRMDRAGMLEALEAGEMGMMSPIDLERLRRQLGMSRKKPAQFNGGGAVSTKAKKKPKKGCVMKGRGGNFKGLK